MAATTTTTTPLPDFDNPGKQVTSPSALAHIVLRANDFEAMKKFYITFLNARIQHENGALCFLTYDEEHHRIALVNGMAPGVRAPKDSTFLHVSFAFPTLAALLLAYRQRRAHGIEPVWSVNHGPTVSLYYQDPEGNTIETQVDAVPTADAANALMMGEDFAENPFGVDFDPEDMIKRLQAGEGESVLMKRAKIGPRGLDSLPAAMAMH